MTDDASCESACHEGKPDKEEQPRPPRDTSGAPAPVPPSGGAIIITEQALLVDQVDDDHAEGGAESGRPVGERDADGDGVVRRVGIGERFRVRRHDGRVEKGPPAQRELRRSVPGEVSEQVGREESGQSRQLSGRLQVRGWTSRPSSLQCKYAPATHESSCEVDEHRALLLAESDARAPDQQHPPGVARTHRQRGRSRRHGLSSSLPRAGEIDGDGAKKRRCQPARHHRQFPKSTR